jgi:hypothetical protein
MLGGLDNALDSLGGAAIRTADLGLWRRSGSAGVHIWLSGLTRPADGDRHAWNAPCSIK